MKTKILVYGVSLLSLCLILLVPLTVASAG